MNPLIYLCLAGIINFTTSTNNVAKIATISPQQKEKIILQPLDKLFVIGDFDGDKKQDTLYQHNYSKLTKSEIKFAPDPYQNDWDQVINWFYKQEANVYLNMNNNLRSKLDLGAAQGLYCLINIGDNNHDGKDEIALVMDKLDYSNINTCKIFSLCNNQWTLLKEFGIHEDAFNFTTKKMPVFTQIKDYLEKISGEWVYKDYSQNEYDRAEDVGKMLPLELNKCK